MKQLHRLATISNLVFLLLGFYIVSHLWGITRLPVFADEAIYIRWAQLIIDDAGRYLFFPLNDGKTPLFIWQMVPLLQWFSDPLFAGRFTAFLGGLVQIFATLLVIKQLRGGHLTQVIGALLITILPFWYFHHRMALMDGWLAAWLTVSLGCLLKSIADRSWLWSLAAGFALGMAFLTKIPAVLFFPTLIILPFYFYQKVSDGAVILKYVSLSLLIGVAVFGSLKLTPVFGQLFLRGSDFLYPFSEVLSGAWQQTLPSTPTYFGYFWHYLTAAGTVAFIASLFFSNDKKRSWLLFISFLSFVAPIALLGKVVYPRYLLPAAIPMTVAIAFFVAELARKKTLLARLSAIALMLAIVWQSFVFIIPSIVQPNKTPFVSADIVQYLTEWSSGHGVREVYLKLKEESKTQSVYVATEGFFGTLPDAMLMYLHKDDTSAITVEGVGQPIGDLPVRYGELDRSYDRYWLLVNSHRLGFEIESKYLIASYCRPYDAPCLQLWDVTELVEQTIEKIE